ncbi:MAG: PH domain-containing protein [Acidimicrobiales bacterium]|nr:PH domain-containing protein [Acidimicrobiales bacterium]
MEPIPDVTGTAASDLEDLDRSTMGSEGAPVSLSPKVIVFWRLPWVIITLLLVLGCTIGALATEGAAGWLIAGVVVLAVGITGGLLLPRARYRRWRYWVTDETIELRHGLVFRAESSIPHFRVQHIDVRQGPLQRSVGVVDMVISTASAATDATLPGVEPERADAIRQVVLARAEADDAV